MKQGTHRAPRRTFGMVSLLLTLVMMLVLLAVPSGVAGAGTDLGTSQNPVRFTSAFKNVVEDMQPLADALKEVTGLEFEVYAVDAGEDAVDWMCGDDGDSSMGLMSSAAYVFAEQCGAGARLHLYQFGSDSYYSAFFVPASSEFETLADLGDGTDLVWYYATNSISSYLVPKGMMAMAGILPSGPVGLAFHTEVVATLYGLEVAGNPNDVVGTAYFDARDRFVLEDPEHNSDVNDRVRLLAKSPAIANSPLVFGPDFPANVRRVIEKALVKMSDPESNYYDAWEGVSISDAGATLVKLRPREFDFLRSALEAADVHVGDL